MLDSTIVTGRGFAATDRVRRDESFVEDAVGEGGWDDCGVDVTLGVSGRSYASRASGDSGGLTR